MTSLPKFIEAGMAFFSKPQPPDNSSTLHQLQAESIEAAARFAESEARFISEISELKAALETKMLMLEALGKSFVSSGAQATQSLIAAGVPPVTTALEPVAIASKGFVALVLERMATGKTKAESIGFCIKNHPVEYIEARQSGGLSRI